MRRRAPILAAIAMLALALAGFFLLVFPKVREVGRTEKALDRAQDEEVVLRAELDRLQELQGDAARLRRRLARFRREVPAVADLPGLINLLQNAADGSAVDFFSVSPGTPIAAVAGGAAEIPAQIQVIGRFFPVDQFLFNLETLERAAKVMTIEVGQGPDSLPQIQVTLEVRFFTTDTTAGPGAPVGGATPGPGVSPTPSPSPSPSPGG